MSLQATSSSLAFPDKGSYAQSLWSNVKRSIVFINLRDFSILLMQSFDKIYRIRFRCNAIFELCTSFIVCLLLYVSSLKMGSYHYISGKSETEV